MTYEVVRVETNQYCLSVLHDDSPENPREWDNIGTMVCFHSRYKLGDEHYYDCPRDFFMALAEEFVNTESGRQVLKRYADKMVEQLKITYSPENGGYVIEAETYKDYLDDIYESEEQAKEAILKFHQDLIEFPDWNDMSTKDMWDVFSPHVVILPLFLLDHSLLSISTTDFGDPWDSGLVGWIYAPREKFVRETGFTPEELFEGGKAEEILKAEVEVYDCYLRGEVYGYLLEKREKCPCCGQVKKETIDSNWGFYGDNFKDNGMIECIKEVAPEEIYRELEKAINS